eukprot:Gb_34092 [translate_table: standard]
MVSCHALVYWKENDVGRLCCFRIPSVIVRMALSFDCVSSLLCGEDASVVAWDDEVGSSIFEGESVEHLESTELAYLPDFPLEDDEAVSLLVQKESDHLPREDYLERFRNRALDITARQDAISWILKVQAHYNFGPLTAYLSINYLDRFLSSHCLPQGTGWPLQLLSVACLSLAAKMEETEVPLLLDLQVGDAKFVFEARTIRRMELLIMTTLKWRMRSITPFNFIDYFVYMVEGTKSVPRSMIARAIELILNTNRVIDFLDHRPSAIAAAAVLCASEEVLHLQATDYKNAILSCETVSKENIFRCYNLMQELLIDICWTPKKLASGFSLTTPHSPIGVLDAAACASCDSVNTSGSRQFEARKRKLNDSSPRMVEDQRWSRPEYYQKS